MFKIKADREYDHAFLYHPQSVEARPPIRLRYLDTNTFTTTATLAPGMYSLNLRSNQGFADNAAVAIDAKNWYYEVKDPRTVKATPTAAAGPKLTGTIYVTSGVPMPGEIAVIFLAHQVHVQRVQVMNGRFTIPVPAKGQYRIEIHALGIPPRTWVSPLKDIQGDSDLGIIALQ